MTFYRAYFSVGGHIVNRQEFHAESDQVAVQAAEKVADACSDAYDELQIWSGARLVASVKAPMPSLVGRRVLRLRARSLGARQA